MFVGRRKADAIMCEIDAVQVTRDPRTFALYKRVSYWRYKADCVTKEARYSALCPMSICFNPGDRCTLEQIRNVTLPIF